LLWSSLKGRCCKSSGPSPLRGPTPPPRGIPRLHERRPRI